MLKAFKVTAVMSAFFIVALWIYSIYEVLKNLPHV
ncbi:MAG: hypothetical protein JWQ09_1136 [Segetibacter sp.]|nr:hypothetical protein [Segetibacter sp.]